MAHTRVTRPPPRRRERPRCCHAVSIVVSNLRSRRVPPPAQGAELRRLAKPAVRSAVTANGAHAPPPAPAPPDTAGGNRGDRYVVAIVAADTFDVPLRRATAAAGTASALTVVVSSVARHSAATQPRTFGVAADARMVSACAGPFRGVGCFWAAEVVEATVVSGWRAGI